VLIYKACSIKIVDALKKLTKSVKIANTTAGQALKKADDS
jgi:hypothetical protein